MKENEYYNEIESYIKRNEINKRRRVLEENYDTLNNYWEIGRLIVELQNGESRAKYGESLVKKWSLKFTENYGKGYSYANLKRFKQFYLVFQKGAPVGRLSWTNIKILLPINDTNKRNYYINLCIEKNLSKRALEEEIKSNSYERLLKAEKIDIISSRKKIDLLDNMKNPIIIKVDKNKEIKNEKDLELTILSQIEFVLTQLGNGYTFVGSQYKINNYYIDILLFNIKSNSYVVVELKLRKLKIEDKAQVEKYMKLIDDNLKEVHHNKTMGIIISKEQDKFVVNFVRKDNLIPLTYELINN